jgi:hypothetical protein
MNNINMLVLFLTRDLKVVDVHVKDKSVLLRMQLMKMIISDTLCGGVRVH